MRTLTADALRTRYPQLSGLLARCRKPERDAQILSLALIAGARNEEIAQQVGVSRSVVAHVVLSARRFLSQHDDTFDELPALPLTAQTVWSPSGGIEASSADPSLQDSIQAPPIAAQREDVRSVEHVDSILFDLAAGLSPLDAAAYRGLANHLVACEHCQVALGVVIDATTQKVNASDARSAEGRDLLTRLGVLLQRTRIRSHLVAYAETWTASGELVAQQSFPDVAEHLRTCHSCRSSVEEWILQRDEQAHASSELLSRVDDAPEMNDS